MRVLPLLPLLSLAACAGESPQAPSLLPRPIESRSEAEPVLEQAAAVPDATLDAAIAERTAAFATAAAAFDAARPGVVARVTRAARAPEGSDAWLDAQQALGELQQARTAADGAMADLEALAITRASEGRPPYPALDTAIAAAAATLARQSAAEAELKAIGGS